MSKAQTSFNLKIIYIQNPISNHHKKLITLNQNTNVKEESRVENIKFEKLKKSCFKLNWIFCFIDVTSFVKVLRIFSNQCDFSVRRG